jgi:hypothetical protein
MISAKEREALAIAGKIARKRSKGDRALRRGHGLL